MNSYRDSVIAFMMLVIVAPLTGCTVNPLCEKVYSQYVNPVRVKRLPNSDSCDPLDDTHRYAACVAAFETVPAAGSFVAEYGITVPEYFSGLKKNDSFPESDVVKKYGVFLLETSVMLKDYRMANFFLRSGVDPFTSLGHLGPAVSRVIMFGDRSFWEIVQKYYPQDEYSQSLEVSAYLEQCKCGAVNTDGVNCWKSF